MTTDLNEYVFRLKKGDMEIEIRSNDPAFMQAQMENWRQTILGGPAASPAAQPVAAPIAAAMPMPAAVDDNSPEAIAERALAAAMR